MSVNCTGLRAVDGLGLFPFHNWELNVQPSWGCDTSSTKHYLHPRIEVTAIGKKYVLFGQKNGKQKFQWTISSKPSLLTAAAFFGWSPTSARELMGISQLSAPRPPTLSDNYNISTSDSSRTIKHRGTEVKPQIRSQLHGNCCAHHRNWCGLIFMSCGLIRTGTKQSPCQKEPVLLRRWSRRWLMTALQLSQECQCSVRSVLKKGFQMLLPAAFSSHTEELLEWPNLLQRPLEKALDSHCCFPKKG